MLKTLERIRGTLAILASVTLFSGGSPASASDGGFGTLKGPITAWLADAPAGCVPSTFFDQNTGTGPQFPRVDHVAYWIGSAMEHDREVHDADVEPVWQGITGGAEVVRVAFDPQHGISYWHIGKQDMSLSGAFSGQPPPPVGAPSMHAELSAISIAGNIHLGDSLATVTRSLGLHALAPTPVSVCPGLSVVEVCPWNARGCDCPNFEEWRRITAGLHDTDSGTIVFRNARVIGFLWSGKCFASG